MNRLLVVAVAAALGLPFTTHAQSKSDYEGTWTMDLSRSESQAGVSAGPVTHIISVADGKLIIHIQQSNRTETLTYNSDGSETLNGSGTAVVKASLRWDGLKLVTSTIRMINGMAVTSEQVRTLTSDGKEMVVETMNK